ncbi:hypothetical protein JW962_03305 [Candidatus Dojkabacteria bacterium]|nr:hypothetical protein [Candidatus Dojkabacteria bacterium]
MAKTFSNFDKFGLDKFADDLTNYLQVESEFVDESFVLSLNSEFGSGKSTFFEMWMNELKAIDKIFEIVYVNAWESDFQGDPLLAIVSCLLDIEYSGKNSEPIKESAGKLCKFALSIGNDVVQRVTGVDFIKAGERAEADNNNSKTKLGHACFELYEQRQKLFEDLKKLLCETTRNSDRSVLIIVDELDRCRPNYAIEFLETIKHFFDIKGLVFVLGVDKKQLASSAKALFGQGLAFDRYYQKFVHRNVYLPVKSEAILKVFCKKIIKEYLSNEAFKKKGLFSYAEYDSNCEDTFADLCVAFSLNARDLHEALRITAHVFSMVEQKNTKLIWGFQYGTFFMSILSIKDRSLYEKIGTKNISPTEFTEYLKPLMLFNNTALLSDWWAKLLYIGVFGYKPEILESEFIKLSVWSKSEGEAKFENYISDFSSAFGRFASVRTEAAFLRIYAELEGLRRFEKGK